MKKLFIILFTIFSISLGASTYYVAPTGNNSNPGTLAQPWLTWQKAFLTANAGDTVYFRGGVYLQASSNYGNNINLISPFGSIGHNGTYSDPICYFNYPGETPILDCSLITSAGNFNVGIMMIRADYLKFKGLTIRNVWQRHTLVEAFGWAASDCSNTTFENCTVYDCGGNAFRWLGSFGAYPGITSDTTRFINCDAYHCCDSLMWGIGNIGGAGDGFKLDNEADSYISFEGCRAWNCSDDGFDMSGSLMGIFKNCWSVGNGYLFGDGTGFKFGAVRDNVVYPTRFVTNCLAAFNRGTSFSETDNSDYYRSNARIFNNTSYGGQYGFWSVQNPNHPARNSIYINNISYGASVEAVSLNYNVYTERSNTWDWLDATPGSWPWYVITDTVTVTDIDFISIDSTGLSGARKSDWSLPNTDFLRLASTSDLIDAGTTYLPDVDWITYSGTHPDIGYAEYNDNDTTALVVFTTSAYPSINYALIGVNVYDDGGDPVTTRGVCWGTSANPTIANDTTINGSGTGTFSARIEPLLTNTTYHVRGYAINQWGTGYGEDLQFTTLSVSDKIAVYAGGKPLYDPATGKQIFTHAGSLPQTVLVTGITVGGGSAIAVDGGTLQLNTTVLPANATNKTVTWSVTNGTGSATISATGLATAVTNGQVTARATANDASGIYDDQAITISNQDIVTSISVWGTGGATTITSDDGTLQMLKKTLPISASDTTVTWSVTSGTGTASISSAGLLTAFTNGTVTVRAIANDGSGVYGTKQITLSNQTVSEQIIADHTIVDRYDDIPAEYITEVKKMLIVIGGESHSGAYVNGLALLETSYPTYAQEYSSGPAAYTDQYLRVTKGIWGDVDHASDWMYSYGEEDWFTSALAISRTKAGITYTNTLIPTGISAILFGWCSDMLIGDATAGTDPVYGVHWYGASVGSPEGDKSWGLDAADYAQTANSVSMDSYLAATQAYNDYCVANGYSTKAIYTTGPVEAGSTWSGERGYQGHLKHEYIRNYVAANASRILLDYADILCYDNDGTPTTTTWNGHTYPKITATNEGSGSYNHIDLPGHLRLGKALWWMLARIAGWDGN